MSRKLELEVTGVLIVLAGACASPQVDDGVGESSSTSTPLGSTSGEPLPPGTTSSGGTTDTPSPDGTTSGSSSSSSSSSGGTAGFIFDVGGGMTTGELPDLPPVIDWDCDNLVEPYVSQTELVAARGYHDVAFDQDGHILGWDGNSILQVTYDDVTSVFLPGVGGVENMDWLENGDLLLTNGSGELRRVTPALQNTVVVSGLSGAYGITVGPDQQAYVATSTNIRRVDPDTGAVEIWLSLPGNVRPRAMVFNLDSTGAYVSTLTSGGPVYFVELDQDLDPTGPATLFASNVGESWHDGIAIDACGNVYVPEFWSSGLYRIDPEGNVTTIYDENTASQSHYGHNVEFGSGIDGWNDRALYLPQPYDGSTVNEVVLGVPSGSLVRTWNP